MANIKSVPAATSGVSASSTTTAWSFGSWVEITSGLSVGLKVIGIQFQESQNNPGTDVTRERLFEIGIGPSGSEVTKLQIPSSIRSDTTAYGHYQPPVNKIWLPEPYLINANTRIAVRVADSTTTAVTYDGIKLIYEENLPPSVVLNSPANGATITDTTPTLEFTGTDPDGEDVRYNTQIDTVDTFNSVVAGGNLSLNLRVAAASDPTSARSLTTGTGTSTTIINSGIKSSEFSLFEDWATDAFGGKTIAAGNWTLTVRMRLDPAGDTASGESRWRWKLYKREGTTNTLLGTSPNSEFFNNTTFNQKSLTISGVAQQILDPEDDIFIEVEVADDFDDSAFEIEIENSSNQCTLTGPSITAVPLLNKVSGDNPGFANIDTPADTDPFNSGDKVGFTVQSGDELDPDTEYFWRVRAIDPSGSNTWGDWSTVRSFTTAAGGTTTSDNRSARTKGVATASNTRNARAKGLSTTSDTRNARTKGVATASDTRSARTKGIATISDNRNARTKGSLTTSDTRDARTKGVATTSDTRNARTKGVATTSDNRSARTKGSLTASDTRGARTKGLETLMDNRSARTKGLSTTSDTRNARVKGSLTVSDTRNAITKGFATLSDTRPARIRGIETVSETRNARTKGIAVATNNRPARTKGYSTATDNRPARTKGYLVATDNRPARTKGVDTTSNTRGARTKGLLTASNTRSARTKGVATTSDTRNARIKGYLTTSDTRNARIKGVTAVSDTRGARTKGLSTASDTRNARTKGVATASDTRPARVKGQITTSDTRNAKTKGVATTTSDTRNARTKGYLTTSDARGARIKSKLTASDFRDAHTKGGTAASDTRGARLIGAIASYRSAKVKGPDPNYPKFIFVDGELAIHLFGKFYMTV